MLFANVVAQVVQFDLIPGDVLTAGVVTVAKTFDEFVITLSHRGDRCQFTVEIIGRITGTVDDR